MRILLPPSETKVPGGGKSQLRLDLLSRPELTDARAAAIKSLTRLAQSPTKAARILKLSTKQLQYVEDDSRVESSPTMPAIERYTGVLFDALDVSSLTESAVRWIAHHVSIQSALFGLLNAYDEIPTYRLSASTPLPGLRVARKMVSLKTFWQHHHDPIWSREDTFILDLRSKDYQALAPVPANVEHAWLHIVTRTPDGQTRALNHFNKSTKGLLVRVLSEQEPFIDSKAAFLTWAQQNGIECAEEMNGDIVLIADSVSVKAGQSVEQGRVRNS